MGIQLYPPIIPATLNAMYIEENQEGVYIEIPFQLNRAVSAGQIYGFNIQIKTVFTNRILINQNIEPIENNNQNISTMIENRLIQTYLTENINSLLIGEYYKVQIAFLNKENPVNLNEDSTLGYQSSVATIKYTSKPIVSIQNLDAEAEYNPFTYFVQGNYDNSGDLTETRSEYCFELFEDNEDSTLYQSSGWLIRDPDKEQDEYTFQDIEGCTTYKLKYSVKTINNLIVESPFYFVEQAEVASDIEQDYDLIIENNFNNAYVIARIQPKEDLHLPPADVDGMFRLLRRSNQEDRFIEVARKHIVLNDDNNHIAQFQDFLIEQGETYGYAVQQYNDNNIYSIKKPDISGGADPIWITIDFEDSFLWDGEKQLKIKFNPKVSSFKINRQEQKMETSGSQFPFFTRNGKIAYHEFPISGLISYQMDEEELFMTDEELGLTKGDDIRSKTEEDLTIDFLGRYDRTLTLQGYNFAAERKFKNTVLEWLGNGKPKFFKSPSEGNFIIRIMNPSLTPEDKVSRMIHNFSATGYETMEINSKNLLENKFYKDYDEDSFIGIGQIFNKILNTTKVNNKYDYYIVDPDTSGSFNQIKNGIANNGSYLIKKVIIKRKKLKAPLIMSTTPSVLSSNYTLNPVFTQEDLSQPMIEFQDRNGTINFDIRNIYDIRTIVDTDKQTIENIINNQLYDENKSQSFYYKRDGHYELMPERNINSEDLQNDEEYGVAMIKKYLYDNHPPFNKISVSINSTTYNSNQNKLYYYKNNEEYILGEETFVSGRQYYQRDRFTSILFVKINNTIQTSRASRLRGIQTNIQNEDNYKFRVITKDGPKEVLVTEEQPYTNFQTFQDFSINCDSMPITLYIEVEYYDYKPIFATA